MIGPLKARGARKLVGAGAPPAKITTSTIPSSEAKCSTLHYSVSHSSSIPSDANIMSRHHHRTCVCKNNAPPVLQRMPRRLSQCCTEGLSTFRKQICGDPFQCWGCRPAAGRNFSPNIKERLFCKPPHHPMLKQDKCLCALARLA